MIKKACILFACVFVLGIFPFTTGKTRKLGSSYHKITAEQAKEMMEKSDVTLVDVRTREEYEAGHIPGAILFPNESISAQTLGILPDQQATLLIYCRSGRRSREAASKLVKLGYQKIYDFGGIIDWPYDIITEK